MEYRRRNSLRAKGYAYGAGYYAVVILTAERQRFFGEIVGQIMQVSELGSVVLQMWSRIPELHSHVTLDEFQIMPDHFHGILILNEKYQHMNGAGVGEGKAGALSDALTSAEPAEGVTQKKIALSDAQTGMGEGEAGVGEGETGALSDAQTGVGEGEAGALSDALTSEQSRRAQQFKAGSLSVIINSFKASVSGAAHRDFPHLPIKIWHRSFFDTIIRDEKHLNNMRQYIRNNVQQWQE